MKAILKAAVFSVLVLTLTAAARAQSEGDANANILVVTKMTGAWRVNYAESDNPMAKMRAMLQGKSATATTDERSAANADAPPMSISIFPPETIVLADDGDEKSVTINENFSQIVYTRTVSTDGLKRFNELENGASFSVAAIRKNDALKIVTESPRGNHMIENYEIADGGKKLIVIVRFENEQSREIFTLRRVYDRILPEIMPAETEELQ